MTEACILSTKRLRLREASFNDESFILSLVTQPAWLKYIAPHAIDTVDKAREYIKYKLIQVYRENGFGLWVVETKINGEAIGICGLMKRTSLQNMDLGFAFLPDRWGQGFAQEAAEGTLVYASTVLQQQEIYAISHPENHRSIRLLDKLGFSYRAPFRHEKSGKTISLYIKQLT